MGAERPTIRSGDGLGRRRGGIGDDAGQPGGRLRARRRHERDRRSRGRLLCHRRREAAMAMMSADGLVVAVPGRAIEGGGDLRTAAGRGDIDVVGAVQRAREQIDNRDQHGQQPTPMAWTAGSRGLAVGEHEVTLVGVCARPSMAAGTVSTRNIVTSLEQLPQQCGVTTSSWADAEARAQGECLDTGGANRFTDFGDVSLHGNRGVTARFHRPLQPFDGLVDPFVLVLGIGEGLLPECIGLMQARRSAIHAPLPIWTFRPDRILDDPGSRVVNIRQVRKGPSRTNRLGPHVLTISTLGT